MRNKLLATVAVAAVVGFGGFAAAQSQMSGESNKATPGASSGATQQKSGGGMSGAQSGNKTLNPSSTESSNPSRNQSAQEKSGKTNERLGQGPKEEQNESARGAQRETGQAGATGGARGDSVQLSEDQRSQIKTVIGRGSGPRLSRSNVNFSISVGTRVPRSVHFVTLPGEIVRIVPQYRGFDYFLVEDEIVIVDPRTLEIVAVIPA